jgi:Flp pilus assembly protein TadG
MRTRGTSHNLQRVRDVCRGWSLEPTGGPELIRIRLLDDDRGSLAGFTALIAAALVLLVGLLFDGGHYIRAQSDTFGIAAAAARTAAQELDETAVLQGTFQLDEEAAQAAAISYLAARNLTGSVHIDGLEVSVTAHRTVDFQLLPGSARVDSTATVRASVQGPS